MLVHGDDLAYRHKHGRGFWVMDQMPALREIAKQGAQIVTSSAAYLFKPGETFAIRNGSMNGTPLPHEEPQELNPPAGVIAYYWLKTPPTQPLKDRTDRRRRYRPSLPRQRYSSAPCRYGSQNNVQAIWEQPAQPPSTAAGMHRVALNVGGGRGGFGRGGAAPPVQDACTAGTPPPAAPAGEEASRGGRGAAELLQPGHFTVRLTVDGKTFTQPSDSARQTRAVKM